MKELTDIEEEALFIKIKNEIINRLQKLQYNGHLDDLGNEIGIAVGEHTCKNNKDLNMWAFDKNSFTLGFEHGYSLKNGTH